MVDIEKFYDGNSKLVCKVSDFGFSVVQDSSGQEKIAFGTTTYMAPEIVSQKAYDKSVDIWALGVIVYLILTGMAPFRGEVNTKKAMYQAIVNKPLNLSPLNRYF